MAFLACVRARTMVVTGPSRSIVVVMRSSGSLMLVFGRAARMWMPMRMVSMGMGGCGLAIGPAFRVERRFDRDAFAAERCNQRFQRMVAPQPNAIGKQLDSD